MKLIKNIAITIFVLAALLIAGLAYHIYSEVFVATTEEVIPANESADIKAAAYGAVDIVENLKTTYAARAVHAKGHACVKAYVDVRDDISKPLQHGVFSVPGKQYRAWVRFSNSSSNMAKSDDNAKDARGMAVKLLNTETNLSGGNTQEFIAHNSPAFFVKTVQDYNQFVASKGDPMYFLRGYNPFNWRLRELWQLIKAYSPPPASPLWTEYFSNTAYKLGPHNVKFKMKPCAPALIDPGHVEGDPDFLRHTLAHELAIDSACMQLAVQVQKPTAPMPIEDATVLWKESDSPFIPVANIIMKKQKVDTPEQQQFCEELSFSPWNALAAHKPVGALNRARRIVYKASSNYRHKMNGTKEPTALDWDKDVADSLEVDLSDAEVGSARESETDNQ